MSKPDKKSGYIEQQLRRNRKRDDRQNDSEIDERLEEGFALLEDDEQLTPKEREVYENHKQ